MDLVMSIHQAAKTLLVFFHQICKGKNLLDVDWEKAESVKRIARISETEAKFLKFVVGIVENRGKGDHHIITYLSPFSEKNPYPDY